MNLEDFCREVEKRLHAAGSGDRVGIAAEALRAAFRVRPDEVSLFSYNPQLDILRFLWPRHLQQSGMIPLAARQSLVSRTFNDNRPFLDNRFSSSSHLGVFEIVPETRGSGVPLPIQKIISAPIGSESGFRGVVQICRKGETPDTAGVDFSQGDLKVLVRLADLLGRCLEYGGGTGGEGGCAS